MEDSTIVDNPPLLYTAAKGQFIKDAGLAGFAMWEAGSDSYDILLDTIKSEVGSTGC
jgi:chitinase